MNEAYWKIRKFKTVVNYTQRYKRERERFLKEYKIMPVDIRHLRENASLYVTNQRLRKLSTDPVTSTLNADSRYRSRLALLESLTAYRRRVQKNKKVKSCKVNTLKFLKPLLTDLKTEIDEIEKTMSLSIRSVASLPPNVPLSIPTAETPPPSRNTIDGVASKPYHMIL